MDELLIPLPRRGSFGGRHRVDALLNEVLNGLHVMVRYLLNILDTLGVGRRKRPIDIAKRFEKAMVEILKLG